MYQRIRDLREDKDMTQTQMAEVLNCSQRVYSNYEKGERDIPTDILIALAKFHNHIHGLHFRLNKQKIRIHFASKSEVNPYFYYNDEFYYEKRAFSPFSRNRITKACFQVEVKTAAIPTPKFPLHYTKALYHP